MGGVQKEINGRGENLGGDRGKELDNVPEKTAGETDFTAFGRKIGRIRQKPLRNFEKKVE